MKKWMLLTAVAVVAVIAVGVYLIVAPESDEYSGSSYSADCSMNIKNDSFELTLTEYTDNSYLSVSHIYSGRIISDRFTVNSHTTQYREFGKIYKEMNETGISVPLTDMVLFREVTGGYLVKDAFVKRSSTGVGSDLLYVTTQEAIDAAGCDITLMKGSSVNDIAKMTVVEVYSDGTVCRYPVDAERIGTADLETLGESKIYIGYGDGRTAIMSLEIVPFVVEKNEIMNRGSSFEYALETGKIVIDKAEGVGDINVSGWDSSDGYRRIWLSSGDYSESIVVTFTSDNDRTVKSISIGMEHYIRAGTDLPVFNVRMELNNGKVYDIQSNDPQLTLSGYNKDTVGKQTIRMTYLNSQADVIIYSYNDSNLIPKEAHLINVNKLYDCKDSLLLYTDKGINYGNYSIRYVMCDGTVRNMPLTQDIVEFKGEMDPQKRTSTSAVIITSVEGYRYSETAAVVYDSTDEDIRDTLTFANIIGDRTSAYYSMVTENGTYATSFGYRMYDEFYVAHDMVTSSSYLSKNVRYVHGESESFTLFLSRDHTMDMDRSILSNCELVKYEIDHNDVKYAYYSLTMTAEDVEFFSGFGFVIGDKISLKVTYDGIIDMSTGMDISKDGRTLAVGTFVYGEGVMLSDEIEDYVDNYGTISLMMKFDDGRDDHSYRVNIGTMDLKFECDEGYGVYVKEGKIFVPFEMPPIGITTTTETYYLGSYDAEVL